MIMKLALRQLFAIYVAEMLMDWCQEATFTEELGCITRSYRRFEIKTNCARANMSFHSDIVP